MGDIVRVRRDDQFPADLVLVSTSSNNGKCFVMTANLDGETNLKPLFASKGRFFKIFLIILKLPPGDEGLPHRGAAGQPAGRDRV